MRKPIVAFAIAAVIAAAAAAATPASAQVIERFSQDPFSGHGRNFFWTDGDAAARFAFLPDEASHFPGDRDGTLRVVYDTLLPTARLSTSLPTVWTTGDDFDFGAILTIRSDGFFADPNGFSQIAFGLWNGALTGLNRTGFPSDSFDTVEFDYFPNVTEFGGPFVSPTVFGGEVGGNAFFNFAFASAESALPLDVPLLVRGHYSAADRRLRLTVARHVKPLSFERIDGATVNVDLSRLSPTFLLNAIGIAGYFEGYPSIHVVVDYDVLFTGPLPSPWTEIRPRRTPGQ